MSAQNKLIFTAALLLAMLSVAQTAETEPNLSWYIEEYKKNSNEIPEEKMSVVDKFGTMVAENHVENFKERMSNEITIAFVNELRATLYYANVEEYNNNEDTRVSAAENYFNEVDVENIVNEFDRMNELTSSFPLDGKSKTFAQFLYKKIGGPCNGFLDQFEMLFSSFDYDVEKSESVNEIEVKQFIHNWALYLVCRRTRDYFHYVFKDSPKKYLHKHIKEYEKNFKSIPEKQDDISMSVVEKFGTMVAENHVKNFKEIMSNKITIGFVEKLMSKLYYANLHAEKYDKNENIRVSAAEKYFNEVDVENIVKELDKKKQWSSFQLDGKSKTFAQFLYKHVGEHCARFYGWVWSDFNRFQYYVETSPELANEIEQHGADDKVKQFIRDWALYLVCCQTLDFLLHAPVFEDPPGTNLRTYVADYKKYYDMYPEKRHDMPVVKKLGTMVAELYVENFKKRINGKIKAQFVYECGVNLRLYRYVNRFDHRQALKSMLSIFKEGVLNDFVREFGKIEEFSISYRNSVLPKLMTDNVQMPCLNYVKNFDILFASLSEYIRKTEFAVDLKENGADSEVKKLIRDWTSYLVCRRTLDFIRHKIGQPLEII